LIRITVAAIEYESTQEASYDIVSDNIKKGLDVLVSEGAEDTNSDQITKWAHGTRTAVDENWRAPVVCAYNLRAEIMKIRQSKILEKELHVNEELNILAQVSNFVTGKYVSLFTSILFGCSNTRCRCIFPRIFLTLPFFSSIFYTLNHHHLL